MTDTRIGTAARDAAYRRLLRWYPSDWRARHGEALLGILLDAAEDEGRTRPSTAERWSVAIDGAGHRLDRRVAIGCAIAAVLAGLAAAALWVSGAMWGSPALGIGVLAISTGLVPLLQSSAVIATGRTRGLVTASAALAALVVAVPAATLAALSELSWSIGFDDADAGRPQSALAAAWPALALSAWALGAIAWAIVGGGVLQRAGIRRPWHVVLGAVCGVIGVPMVALAQRSPLTGVLVSLGVLAFVVLLTAAPAPAGSTPSARHATPRARDRLAARRAIAMCAFGSAVLGIVAIAFALAGSNWSSLDATEAMRVGIGAGLIAAIPLALTVGIARARSGRSLASAWDPAILLAASAAIAGAANLSGVTADGNVMTFMLWIAAIPAGVAVAWTIASTSWQTRSVRVGIGAVAGLAVVVQGLLLQSAAFVLPVAAIVVAVVAARRARRDAIADARPAVVG